MNDKVPRGMGRNILLLGVVSFLNDFSSEMIMPILPFFIADLGGGDVSLGLIGGARDAIASLLKVPCGYWSDRSGKRKIFATAGYASSAVFKLLLAFSAAWQHVLIFAGLERMGKGIRTAARDAIISESMPNARGKGFGIHRSMDTAGAILGSVVAFLLFFVWEFSFRSIIVAASILALFSLVPLQFVKDKPRAPQSSSLRISLSALPARLRGFVLVAGVFSLAIILYAFGIDFPWYCPFLVIASIAAFITVPIAPGMIGQYHLGVVAGLVIALPNIDLNQAKAVAIVTHALSLLPIGLMGVFCLLRESVAIDDLWALISRNKAPSVDEA